MSGLNPDDYPEHNVRSLKPVPKVTAAGVAGAATVLVVWLVSLFGIDLPDYAVAALTVLITAGTGYLKPSGDA